MSVARLTRGFLLFALMHSGSFQNQPVCGIPGRPLNGQYSPKKANYQFGDTIRYSCPEFNEETRSGSLKGAQTRICLRNGMWSSFVPVCLLNGTDRIIDVAGYYNNYVNRQVMDLCKNPKKILQCTQESECDKLHIFVRFKNGSLPLDGLEMTFLMSKPPNFEAYSEHHNHNARTNCIISDTRGANDGFNRMNNRTTVKLNCYSSKPSTGILLVFQSDQKDEFAHLCHITPLFHPMIFGCDLPDTPLNGYFQQKINGTRKGFDFYCKDDFYLQGPHQSTECNLAGTWSKRSPTCVRKTSVEHRTNDTDKNPALCVKDSNFLVYVIGAFVGAGVVTILAVLIVIVYSFKHKSKVKAVKRVDHSSQRSNSFDISYRCNRSDEGSSNRHSTGTARHLSQDFGQDVPDILENKVLNKVTVETKRAAIPSSHIYSDPIYSETEDERGQSGVMMDNVIYN